MRVHKGIETEVLFLKKIALDINTCNTISSDSLSRLLNCISYLRKHTQICKTANVLSPLTTKLQQKYGKYRYG